MKKKAFSIFLIFIFFILAVIFICPKLINTEKIKNRIAQDIRGKYGYDVRIGSVNISLFPGVKARLKKIEVKSPAEGQYFFDLKADIVSASIKLMPLLRRKIEIGRIRIDEPEIIMEEAITGREEKPEEEKPASPLDSAALMPEKTPRPGPDKSAAGSVSVSELVVRNGCIKIKSRKLLAKRIGKMELKDIDVNVIPIALDKPMRMKIKAKLKIEDEKGGMLFLRPPKLTIDDEITIGKQVVVKDLKLGIESLAVSLSGSFSNPEEPVVEANLSTGDVNLDLFKDFINFANGQAMSGTMNFEGNMSGQINQYSKDNLKGSLEFKEAEFSGFVPNSIYRVTGRLDLSASSVLKEFLSGNLETAQLIGRLSLPSGIFNKIRFQNLNSEISYENNIFNLSPVEFLLYGGNFKGAISASNLRDEPYFNMKAEVRDFQVEKFLADTSTLKDTICGKLYSNLAVTGKGKDLPKISRSLKGNMHFELKDGKITTLNLLKAILSVAGMLTGVRPPEGDYTQVDVLTGDAIISEGKAETNNLRLVSKGMEVTGQGYFKFDQNINFTMDAYVGTAREGYEGGAGFIGKYLKDKFGRIVVPIKITGTVSRPHVSLDTSRLARDIINQEIKDLLPRILK